jgi:hypothetical protein
MIPHPKLVGFLYGAATTVSTVASWLLGPDVGWAISGALLAALSGWAKGPDRESRDHN